MADRVDGSENDAYIQYMDDHCLVCCINNCGHDIRVDTLGPFYAIEDGSTFLADRGCAVKSITTPSHTCVPGRPRTFHSVPGCPISIQIGPGCPRATQIVPGSPRSSHSVPGRTITIQIVPGRPRSSHSVPGRTIAFHNIPGCSISPRRVPDPPERSNLPRLIP